MIVNNRAPSRFLGVTNGRNGRHEILSLYFHSKSGSDGVSDPILAQLADIL